MELLKEERHTKIVDLLKDQRRVRVSELARLFNTTGVTIRRDLRKLEQEGMLHRTYGGAVGNDKVGFEFSFREKISRYTEEKRRIGEYAANLIEDGDTVIIGSGTTCLHLAKNIKDKKKLTVVTNALDIISELHSYKNISVILLGGVYLSDSFSLVGPMLTKIISDLHVDKSFLGTDGISPSMGTTSADVRAAEVNRLMLQAAKERIIVTDHSKIGKVSFASVVPVKEINKIIVDTGITEEDKMAFEEEGVEVIVV